MNNDKYLALNTARLSSVCAQSVVTNLRWKSLTAFALQISASYDDSLSQQLSTMSRTISNLVRWGVVFERGPRDNKLRAGNHFIVVITDLHHATCITQQQQQCNYTPLQNDICTNTCHNNARVCQISFATYLRKNFRPQTRNKVHSKQGNLISEIRFVMSSQKSQ